MSLFAIVQKHQNHIYIITSRTTVQYCTHEAHSRRHSADTETSRVNTGGRHEEADGRTQAPNSFATHGTGLNAPECTKPLHSQSLADFVANVHSQGLSAARTTFFCYFIRKTIRIRWRIPSQRLIRNFFEVCPNLLFLAFLDFLAFSFSRNSLRLWPFFPSFPRILGVRQA